MARLHALESQLSIDYQLTSAEAFAETQGGQFDLVTCLEMLEHVPEPASVVQAAATLCARRRRVFLHPQPHRPGLWPGGDGAEYLLKLLPKGTHDYQRFIRPSRLALCVGKRG